MQATPEQYAKALYAALTEAEASKRPAIIASFLESLHSIGKLRWIQTIVRYISNVEQQETGNTRVTVRLAHESDDATVQALVKRFVAADSTTVQVELDPAMIGGFEIETDNQRWVGSLAAQLSQLERSLR